MRHPIHHGMDTAPIHRAPSIGASFPAHFPDQGIHSFSQRNDRQRSVAIVMPVIPGRKDMEVKRRQESWEKEHPTMCLCSAPCKWPLL